MNGRKRKSCVVGMSGGVDSTAAAHSLLMEGFSVRGVTFRFFSLLGADARRRDDEAAAKAASACRALGIPHTVVDAGERFKRMVVDYFIDSYRKGMTPNPCIICNERIKFPLLTEAADETGAEYIATGHYARIVKRGGRPFLAASEYKRKDQSYFLYRVGPRYLSRTLFPNDVRTKDEARLIAASITRPENTVTESQDVCFLPDGDLESFLSEHIRTRKGDVLDTEGKKLGEHGGVCFYTIGQRKGLGIASGCPMYVREIDSGRNRIILGAADEMYSSGLVCGSLRMRVRKPVLPLTAKIRFRHEPADISILYFSGAGMTVEFRSPQRAVTPGQSLVLYDGDVVLGGGIIEKGA